MEVIVPAAGLSTRFPGMRPKYTLTDHSGSMMIERAIEQYAGRYRVTIGVLKEHVESYPVLRYLKEKYGDHINPVILSERTQVLHILYVRLSQELILPLIKKY